MSLSDLQNLQFNLKFVGKQRGLVESARPQPPAMKRHRDDDPVPFKLRQPRDDQPREHRRKRDAPAVLEGKNEFARTIAIERARRDPVVTRGIGKTRRADRPLLYVRFAERSLA